MYTEGTGALRLKCVETLKGLEPSIGGAEGTPEGFWIGLTATMDGSETDGAPSSQA